MLVLIAIIGILAALIFAVMSEARDRTIRAKCLRNVRQLTDSPADLRGIESVGWRLCERAPLG